MKEKIQYKSFSIKLVTLLEIGIFIIASILIINQFSKNSQIAKQEDFNIEIAKQEENKIETRDIEVSSRSQDRQVEETLVQEETKKDTQGEENSVIETAQNQEEQAIEEIPVQEVQEPVVEEPVYKTIEEVTISKTMDLTENTGLSKEDFITLIAGVKQDTSGFFEENAGIIYDICNQYELNEIFFCGLISAESGWNIASNHRNTHNYISLMSNGKLISFATVEEGIEEAAKRLHNNYLTPGGKFYYGKTLSAVKTKFCPSSTTWVDLVYGRMKQIVD